MTTDVQATPKVTFGLYAQGIKQDSSASTSSIQSFSDITDLETDNVVIQTYATFEPDFWLLDGTYKFLPTTPVHMGWMTAIQSGSDGSFSTNPTLTITFGQDYDTPGISLNFFGPGQEFCEHVQVVYKDSGGSTIQTAQMYPDNYEYSMTNAVTGVRSLVLTFYDTNKAYRYLRLRSIDYGTLVKFTEVDIIECTLTEQVDPTSVTVPFDVAEIQVHSDDEDFSIVNPAGNYSALQNRQPIDLYEVVNGGDLYMGRLYLDKWENPTPETIKFKCIDQLGVLDLVPYMGGIWTSVVTVETLLTDMLEDIGVPFYLDPDLEDVELKGWLPVGTYRAALQQVAFAAGGYLTCSRSRILQMYKTTLAKDQTVFLQEVAYGDMTVGNQALTLKPLVTQVDLKTHSYVTNTTSRVLYNGSLAAGTYTILFKEPAHTLSPTNCTVVSAGANYAVINVAAPATVTLVGNGYTDTTQVLSRLVTDLDPGVQPAIMAVDTATMVDAVLGPTVLDRVFDYYTQRYLQKATLFASALVPGGAVRVGTAYNQVIKAVVEKANHDLAGGFKSDFEVTGVLE